MTCATCGKPTWSYQEGVRRCPDGHVSFEGEPDRSGRTLTPAVLRPGLRASWRFELAFLGLGVLIGLVLGDAAGLTG